MQPDFDSHYDPSFEVEDDRPISPETADEIQKMVDKKVRQIAINVGVVVVIIAAVLVLAPTLFEVVEKIAKKQNQPTWNVGEHNVWNMVDATGEISNGTEDHLVRLEFVDLQLTSGSGYSKRTADDLSWDLLTITLYNENMTYICDNKITSDCFAVESTLNCNSASECFAVDAESDGYWNGDEVLVLEENGVNICDRLNNTTTCDIRVSISFNGMALDGDKNRRTIT